MGRPSRSELTARAGEYFTERNEVTYPAWVSKAGRMSRNPLVCIDSEGSPIPRGLSFGPLVYTVLKYRSSMRRHQAVELQEHKEWS
jgi:hypothetical protein